MFWKNAALKNFSKHAEKLLCRSLVFNKAVGCSAVCHYFNKKEIPALVLSCEFCKCFQSSIYGEHCEPLPTLLFFFTMLILSSFSFKVFLLKCYDGTLKELRNCIFCIVRCVVITLFITITSVCIFYPYFFKD